MRRPNERLIAAPPISTGKSHAARSSSCTQSGICFDVETSSADRPIASAPTSIALSMIVLTGTCLPRSNTV